MQILQFPQQQYFYPPLSYYPQQLSYHPVRNYSPVQIQGPPQPRVFSPYQQPQIQYGYRPQYPVAYYPPQYQTYQPYRPQFQPIPQTIAMIQPQPFAYSQVSVQPNVMLSPSRQIVSSPPRVLSSPTRYVNFSPSRVTVQQPPVLAQSVNYVPQVIGQPLPYPPVVQTHLRLTPPRPGQPPIYQEIQPQKQTQKPPAQKTKSPEQKREDDLDKRFNEAMQRTKKIVEKMHGQQPTPPQKQQEPEQPQKQEEEEPQILEDLALQYEDGYIYRGQGIAPQTRHGFGILTDDNGNEVYSGLWKNNVHHGEGKLHNTNVQEYEEPLDYKDLREVNNYWTFYEGNFNDGQMQGNGIMQFSNGEKYEGDFKEGMISGNGKYFTQDENEIQGTWVEGVFQE